MRLVVLLDEFLRAKSNVIEQGGLRLHSVYTWDDVPRGLLRVTMSGIDDPVQSLQFRVRGGRLRTAGHAGDHLVLWRDTAPAGLLLDVLPKRGQSSVALSFRNCWRVGEQMTTARRNAAMQVETTEARLRFRCSDGVSELDLDDLVAEVRWEIGRAHV